MKKLLTLALTLCLLLSLSTTVVAQEIGDDGMDIIVNDAPIVLDVPAQVWDQVT